MPARRAAALLVPALVGALAVSALVATPALADSPTAEQLAVRIQKIEANGAPDFVELVNTGTTAVDLSGWEVLDDTDSHTPIVFPQGTSLAAHATVSFGTTGATVPGGSEGFGLGNGGDAVRLFLPAASGTPVAQWTVVDSYTWKAAAGSGKNFQRCASGNGTDFALVAAAASAQGAALNCPTAPWNGIRVNEIEANSSAATGDWVELTNTGTTAVDVAGWRLIDDHDPLAADSEWFTFPEHSLAPGDHWSVDLGDLGLGKGGDEVNLYLPDSMTLVDAYVWSAAAAAGTDFSRCPDGTGDFTTSADSRDAANPCAGDPTDPGDPGTPATPTADQLKVRIEKVEANGAPDFVELVNTGKAAIDVSGWQVLDDDDTDAPIVFPQGTSIAAQGTFAFTTTGADVPGGSAGFGLGNKGDEVRVFLPAAAGTPVASLSLVDSFTWTAAAGDGKNFQRCAVDDGRTFQVLAATASAAGAALDCPVANWNSVHLNEVEANGPTAGYSFVKDWVELYNAGQSSVDISGWRFIDDHGSLDTDDGDWFTIADGTTLAAGGLLTLDLGTKDIGLGGTADQASLYLPDDMTLVDQYVWSAPATAGTDASRCPDGTGAFEVGTPTPGALNKCGTTTPPDGGTAERDDAVAWPGSADVTTVDDAATFNGDASGVIFDADDSDVIWVAQNKAGTLWKLRWDAATSTYLPDTSTGWGDGRDPHFVDGQGHPDTEGLTEGPDGAIYMTSERDNDHSTTSRIAVLRIDPNTGDATDGTTATAEWDLNADFPQVSTTSSADANLGPEGMTWVPDSYLVAHGFRDSSGALYDPADYPGHGTGLYVVALEKDGSLNAFALENDGTGGVQPHVLVNSFSSGFSTVMDVAWDPELQALRATCDNTCAGQQTVLALDGSGAFQVTAAYERPTGLPNYNDEGFAVAPQSTCVDGAKRVIWADDGDDEGYSLRAGTVDCEAAAAASTTTTVTTDATGATATVVTADGTPVTSGSVDFVYAGVDAGTVSLGADGSARLDVPVPSDAAHTVIATYSGATGFAGSTTTITRQNPGISATLSSSVSPSSYGWYRAPVTVTFRCATHGSALTSACPEPYTLNWSGEDRLVVRTITAADGGTKRISVTVSIDREPAAVRITGVVAGRTYTTAPKAACSATDALSGIAACTLRTAVSGSTVTLSARATDKAGNVSRTTVTYRRG